MKELFEEWYCKEYWDFRVVEPPLVLYNEKKDNYNHLDVELAYRAFTVGASVALGEIQQFFDQWLIDNVHKRKVYWTL